MAGLSRSLSGLWRKYEVLLQKNPVRTQVATSAVLWALGDVFSQKIEGRKQWNAKRTAYAATFGGALLGPVGHFWYGSLDTAVAKFVRSGTPQFIAAKVAADELLFGPLHVLGFFTFMTKAEGGSWQEVKEKIRRDFWSTYLAELAIWPAFQTINFWKVPVRHQLLAVNLACLLDATFLCWVKNQEDWLAAVGLRAAAPTPSAEQPPSTKPEKPHSKLDATALENL